MFIHALHHTNTQLSPIKANSPLVCLPPIFNAHISHTILHQLNLLMMKPNFTQTCSEHTSMWIIKICTNCCLTPTLSNICCSLSTSHKVLQLTGSTFCRAGAGPTSWLGNQTEKRRQTTKKTLRPTYSITKPCQRANDFPHPQL
jgi:hypothetical protein